MHTLWGQIDPMFFNISLFLFCLSFKVHLATCKEGTWCCTCLLSGNRLDTLQAGQKNCFSHPGKPLIHSGWYKDIHRWLTPNTAITDGPQTLYWQLHDRVVAINEPFATPRTLGKRQLLVMSCWPVKYVRLLLNILPFVFLQKNGLHC